MVESGTPAEELEGDGAPSDDEAFEEARAKVEVSTELVSTLLNRALFVCATQASHSQDTATPHSGDRLLAKVSAIASSLR